MTPSLTLALVDDDRIYQFTTERMLQRLDANIKFLWFKDGEEALQFISDNTGDATALPDILIVDINMPFLDGWQFLDAFRAVREGLAKTIDIYMVSSSNDDRDLVRARSTDGVRDYVEKPITREKLALILGIDH
jgi:two-component system chemotaxis response regulator CheY